MSETSMLLNILVQYASRTREWNIRGRWKVVSFFLYNISEIFTEYVKMKQIIVFAKSFIYYYFFHDFRNFSKEKNQFYQSLLKIIEEGEFS